MSLPILTEFVQKSKEGEHGKDLKGFFPNPIAIMSHTVGRALGNTVPEL